MMFFPLLIVFIIIVLYDHFNEGGSFTFFARSVEFMNSFKADTPRNIKKIAATNCWFLEYKIGKQIFGMIIPLGIKQSWKGVVALHYGNWIDVTNEFLYVSGPYRNFYNMPIRCTDINGEYDKIAFVFENNEILEVDSHDVIMSKLKERDRLRKQSEVKTNDV